MKLDGEKKKIKIAKNKINVINKITLINIISAMKKNDVYSKGKSLFSIQ